MVFVKVRETYDLHTLQDKMTVIGIHTPGSTIIKQNYPGLLMQCKGYRPVSCDVKLACASMLPLDPQGIGLEEGDVAPRMCSIPFFTRQSPTGPSTRLSSTFSPRQSLLENPSIGTTTVSLDILTISPHTTVSFPKPISGNTRTPGRPHDE